MPLIKHRPGAIRAICILIAAGLAILALRALWFRPGRGWAGDKLWQATFEFSFLAKEKGAVVYVAIPVDTSQARVLGQNYFYPGLRQARLRDRKGDVRESVFIAPQAGRYFLRADFQIYCSPTPQWARELKSSVLSAENRDLYLNSEPDIGLGKQRTQAVFQELFAKETDQNKLLEAIADFCEKKIATRSVKGADDIERVLLRRRASTLGRARTMVAFFRIGRIPARLVSGFVLADRPEARPHYWVEVYQNHQWLAYDPENGHRRQLPYYYIPVRRGGDEILRIKGGKQLFARHIITHVAKPKGLPFGDEPRLKEVFDLTRLPIATQTALIMLLLLPVGALITTFVRNVVGVMTFGVFSPTLLALALVYTDWRTAAIIFVIVVIIGIGGRSLLPGLKLMQVPRLSIVFTLVAITMALTLSLLDFIHFSPSGLVVLLPLVVLTNIIDRAYAVADESGIRDALLRLGWTVVVAFVCVLIFRWQWPGRLLLAYPELHLITLALIIGLGLYGSRKLTDFPVLHFLVEDRKKEKKRSADAVE